MVDRLRVNGKDVIRENESNGDVKGFFDSVDTERLHTNSNPPDAVVWQDGGVTYSDGMVAGAQHSDSDAQVVLQSLFDNLELEESPRNYAHIHVRRGRYNVDGLHWTRDGKFRLTGSGIGGTIIKLKDGASDHLLHVDPPSGTNQTFLDLCDLELKGNKQNVTGDYDNLRTTTEMKDIYIQRVISADAPRHGYNIERGWGLEMQNALAERNTQDGLICQSNGSATIQGGRYSNNGRSGLRVPNQTRLISLECNANGSRGVWLQGPRCVVIGGYYYGNTTEGIVFSSAEDSAIFGAYVEGATSTDDAIRLNSDDCIVNTQVGLGNVTDNGARNLVNGWGVNSGDPSTTGDWNGNGKRGAMVRDTSGGANYVYVDGAWQSL